MGSSLSKTAMWILMGLLFLGLAGFGAVNLSGNIRTIGSVGDKPLSVQQYARLLQNEIRAIEMQTRQPLPFARAQEIGLDRLVLQRLVRNRALDHENSIIGLSIGDEALRDEIVQIPAFQGINGEFDPEGYRFALQQEGLSEAEFELSLREEVARALLRRAVIGGVRMPEIYAQTLVDYAGEMRSFTWSALDATALADPLPAPEEEVLRLYYADNAEDFMLPEAKEITYIWLRPEDVMSDVVVPEEELRAEYDARADQYNQPERRLVERLVFSDEEEARRAAAALEVGGTTFNALVADRGLDLGDVDLGDVGRDALDSAADAVFAAETGSVVGPLPSALGPALFRINGILPAQNIGFEEVRAELIEELGLARAVRALEARAQDLDDQLAGGATLEQVAAEAGMTLGTLLWSTDSTEGIAAYLDFRQAARALEADDFPQIQQLEDGSIFAMRLDNALPRRPNPFDAAMEDVRDAWRAAQTIDRLTAQLTEQLSALKQDSGFAQAGLEPLVEERVTRDAFVAGTPPGFMSRVFELAPGEVAIVPAEDGIVIIRLDAIIAAEENAQNAAFAAQLNAQVSQSLALDIFGIYADDVVRRAGPQIDQRALQAVHINFP